MRGNRPGMTYEETKEVEMSDYIAEWSGWYSGILHIWCEVGLDIERL